MDSFPLNQASMRSTFPLLSVSVHSPCSTLMPALQHLPIPNTHHLSSPPSPTVFHLLLLYINKQHLRSPNHSHRVSCCTSTNKHPQFLILNSTNPTTSPLSHGIRGTSENKEHPDYVAVCHTPCTSRPSIIPTWTKNHLVGIISINKHHSKAEESSYGLDESLPSHTNIRLAPSYKRTPLITHHVLQQQRQLPTQRQP